MLIDHKKFLKSLPDKSGVYQMYNSEHKILYIGKAKNLKKRLSNYFRPVKDAKTTAFMEKVESIEIIITKNENAALLLENDLIKKFKPHYNILLKDDKSFPYIFLSKHDFPSLSIYRGPIDKSKGKYFGPFPNVGEVSLALSILQKIFRLRVCSDNHLCNCSRPCLLYQIKLCDAPCVGYINKDVYASQVKLVEKFLRSKIIKTLG